MDDSGLYFIRLSWKYVGYIISSPLVNNVMLWHMCFGHALIKALEHVDSLNFAKNKSLGIGDCYVYPHAKIVINNFPISYSRADAIFDLVHVDV